MVSSGSVQRIPPVLLYGGFLHWLSLMKTLYKYYSDKFDVIKHLKSPSIKLATTASLNDPFEKQLSYDLTKTLSKKMADEKFSDNIEKEKYIRAVCSAYKDVSSSFGIVSLTETHGNILMWAHYAEKHKGFCIGYNDSLFNDLNKIQHDEYNWRGIYKPERIIYDAERFMESTIDNDIGQNALILNAMLKKSPEWAYECEYRSIIPFYMADRFIPTKNSTELLKEIEKDERHMLIMKCENEEGYECTQEIDRSAAAHMMKTYANNENIMMLKNIDIKHINSIFIGSQVKEDEINTIVNLVHSNTERYGHIGVYKYRTHENKFKIYTRSLVNGTILNDISDDLIETSLVGFEYK